MSCDFRGSDLTGTTFHNCNLEKANFSNATQYNISPIDNHIKKAIFTLPDVVGLLNHFNITIK